MKKLITTTLLIVILTTLLCCKNNQNILPSTNHSKVNVVKTEKLSISKKLRENDHLPIEERITLYHQLKKENPNEYNFENEDELTMYGYSFLWDDKITEAIEVFKLIVEQFPNSSNPYDSLGEGYFANGNKELSLINYEKSLALNPENFNAEDYIERIKFPNKKQDTPAEKFVKVYTIKEYKEDLEQLGKTLTKVHLETFKFISKENFWKTIEEKKNLITQHTTYGEFIWHCSEIIANINCSHTSLGEFYRESKMLSEPSLIFPLQTRWVNNKLFVIDALNNKNKVSIKDEIVTINGISVSEIINDSYKHISSQGYVETTKKHFFNNWSTEMIPYALHFPKTYKIQVKGKANTIVLNKSKKFTAPYKDTSIAPCKDNLCLEFIENNKTAVLTISSFNYYSWNNLNDYQKFIDNSFDKINKKGVENLIIDVRFNGGGSPESSIYLLKYLVSKPFVYFANTNNKETQTPFKNSFKGKSYYIIDGHGNSTTGHFMSLVKTLNIGTIVGEELGSNQFCTAGQKICRLSNTKLEYHVANNTNRTTATSLPDEIGILPNHYVTQSIDDYLNNVDTVKEFTLKLIDK